MPTLVDDAFSVSIAHRLATMQPVCRMPQVHALWRELQPYAYAMHADAAELRATLTSSGDPVAIHLAAVLQIELDDLELFGPRVPGTRGGVHDVVSAIGDATAILATAKIVYASIDELVQKVLERRRQAATVGVEASDLIEID